jgi:hypothetical protein
MSTLKKHKSKPNPKSKSKSKSKSKPKPKPKPKPTLKNHKSTKSKNKFRKTRSKRQRCRSKGGSDQYDDFSDLFRYNPEFEKILANDRRKAEAEAAEMKAINQLLLVAEAAEMKAIQLLLKAENKKLIDGMPYRADRTKNRHYEKPKNPLNTQLDHMGEKRGGNGEPCSICTEDFVENSITTTTECNHKFHTDCIRLWCLRHREDTTCPMCRANIANTCRSVLLTDLEQRLFDAIDINDPYYVEEALEMSHEQLNPALLDINIKNENGDTPLTLATRNNNVEIVALLLYYGADVDKLNDDYASAYHIVTSTTRNMDIISLLRQYHTQYYHPSHDLLYGYGYGNW